MRIVLVDDHPEVLASLAEFLCGLGHQTEMFRDAVAALRGIRQQPPDLVLSDVRMPGLDGLGLLAALEANEPPVPVALMTAFSDAAVAIEALRHGAVDYLRKPIDVLELARLLDRVDPGVGVTIPVGSSPQADGLVVGGQAFGAVVALADRLHQALTLPCVIEAETGCGKELIARRIHHGGRADDRRPFIAINCAAISQGLFESELFGHAAGAFTGAREGGAKGKLELSGDGTLFLDEIAELPLEQQAKLLRVIEERAWFPVGSNHPHQLRSRVVCASNRPLADMVAAGRFREDLLYRLKVGYLRIPPLRERREEIPTLARALLVTIRGRLGRGFLRLTPMAEQVLVRQPWPGNIRQLSHVLEIACATLDGRELTEAQVMTLLDPVAPVAPVGQAAPVSSGVVGLALPEAPPADLALSGERLNLDEWQRAMIVAALIKCGDSPVRTAAFLGITRKVLYTLRQRYGLIAGEAADGT